MIQTPRVFLSLIGPVVRGSQPLARRGVRILTRLQQRGSLRLLRLLSAGSELLAKLTDAPLRQVPHGCNFGAQRTRIVLRSLKRGTQARDLTRGRREARVPGLPLRRAWRRARGGS